MKRGRQMYKRVLLKVVMLSIPHLLAILLFTVGVGFAYVIAKTNGDPIDWTYQANPMGENYLVNENCSTCTGEAAAVQKAAATWSNAGAKFTFSYGGTTTINNLPPAKDGINCIIWSSTYFPAGDTTLAETTYWFYTNGDIFEVDCVFNDNKTWSTGTTTPGGQIDLESVMLHEFGHYLSLDHSTVQAAVMWPTIGAGTQKRTLNADDIAGIIAIYGAAAGGPTLNQALDNPNLSFTLGGNANWFPETTTYYYGGSAAQSGAIGNNQSSWLQTTVVGPGTLSFYWKVSSELNYDFLEFYIDGVRQPGPISGTVDWQQKIFPITRGSHTLKWVYVKDDLVIAGSDCGWVDKVVYTGPRPIGKTTPLLPLLLN
jgi:hypothetical protein